MDGLPVTIRLLDPPLHEFLPKEHELRDTISSIKSDSESSNDDLIRAEAILARVMSLQENNPMLGFRGCRLGLVYPEIYQMQIAAIIEAASELKKEGVDVKPDIMMPLVGTREEMKRLLSMVNDLASEILRRYGLEGLHYLVGTMIEVPRAALVAGILPSLPNSSVLEPTTLPRRPLATPGMTQRANFLPSTSTTGFFPKTPSTYWTGRASEGL